MRTRKDLLEKYYKEMKSIKKQRKILNTKERRANKLYNLALTRL